MKIENSIMLDFLRKIDERKYYSFCRDSFLAGPDYKVSIISFFCPSRNPSEEFVCIKRYEDEDYISIRTENEDTITEAFAYYETLNLNKLYQNKTRPIIVFSDSYDIFGYSCLTAKYHIEDIENIGSRYFYLRNYSDFNDFPLDTNLSILVTKDGEIEKIASKLERSDNIFGLNNREYSEDHIGTWALNEAIIGENCYRKRTYFLQKEDIIIGYLRAESGYGKYYEIGWLQTDIGERGKNYAPILVSCFVKDCLSSGLIPDYSYAITDESIRVAEKCGFICERSSKYKKKLDRK